MELTVIIPTGNRPDTLRATLHTVVAQKSSDMQIIVSDNSGNARGLTEDIVRSFADNRICYIKTARRLGMSAHWDFALSHAAGEWVTIVGDDDGLLPDCVDRFSRLVRQFDVEAISTRRCYYTWPAAFDGSNGKLTVHGGGGGEVRDCRRWLDLVVKHGESYKDLPGIYTGSFVRREVMNRIKDKMGRYFSSIMPDLYASVSIASLIPRYYYSDHPLAISGASASSNGHQYASLKREQRAELPFFKENELVFHKSLGDGMVQSKTLFVYESVLQSSPLRTFEIETDIKDQLSLALARPEGVNRNELLTDLRTVAELNEIDFDDILSGRRAYFFKYYLKRKLRRLFKTAGAQSPGTKATIKSEAMTDVYEASLIADEMIVKWAASRS